MSVGAVFQGTACTLYNDKKSLPSVRILRLWLTETGAKNGRPVHWLILLVVVSALMQPLRAQNADPNNNYCVNPLGAQAGGFTLDKTAICVGSTVKITGGLPAGLSNVGYIPQYSGKGLVNNYEVGPSLPPYTKPGSYTILQVGSVNGTGTIACKTITVLPLDPVTFTVKACSGRTANIVLDEASLGQYDLFRLNWGDGNIVDGLDRTLLKTQTAHVYAGNGPYTISITGRYKDPVSCETPAADVQKNAQTFSFATVSQPVITQLKTTGDNSIAISYQAGNGAAVQLQQKDAGGNYAPTSYTGTGSGSFTVQTDAKQVQCFRVVAQDACNAGGTPSPNVCSLVLNAQATSKQNNLSWQPYAGTVSGNQFRYYRILRNGSPVGGTLTNRTTGSYADNNTIECGTQYCYSIEATIAGAAQTVVTSAPTCVTGVNGDAPGNFGNTAVSIEGDHPRLVTILPTTGTASNYTVTVSRSQGASGAFQPVGTLDKGRSTFTDVTADPSVGSYCYQLTYLTSCGLSSTSKPVCTVFLSSKASNTIDWTADSPFAPGIVSNYSVLVIDPLSSTQRQIQLGSNTTYEPDLNDPNAESLKYQIIAEMTGGGRSYSNVYTLRRQPRIFVPDAFTPNGDGNNDEFIPKGILTDQFRMLIYDRWGEVIFSTTDKTKGWDGTINGQPALAGQYMYRIDVQDLTGQQTVRTGGLLLIR